MKKITLTLIMLGGFIMVNAQTDKEYNPYQHQREEYIKTGEEFFEEFKKVDCNEIQEFARNAINGYYSGEYTEKEIEHFFSRLGKMYCPEIIDFFENVIAIDNSEKIRCDAMQKLGWLRAKNSVPILMNQLNKDISDFEKACIGASLTVIGEWELAIPVLNSVCFCKDYDIRQKCLWSYYIIGNEPAIRYFNYFFEFQESRLWAANYLARLGKYEKTFPIFVEAIQSGITNNILSAIDGLAAIGTEEAFQLIREQTQSKNEVIAKEAKWIFEYINIKRREK